MLSVIRLLMRCGVVVLVWQSACQKFVWEIPTHYRVSHCWWASTADPLKDCISWDTDKVNTACWLCSTDWTSIFNELIYYYVASKTLLMTDLFCNFLTTPYYPMHIAYRCNNAWELAPVNNTNVMMCGTPNLKSIRFPSNLFYGNLDESKVIFNKYFHGNKKRRQPLGPLCIIVWMSGT